MDSESWFVPIVNLCLAIWFGAMAHALSELSWGKLKKLDGQKRRRLIDLSERLLEERKQYLLTLHLLTATNLVVLVLATQATLVALLGGHHLGPPLLFGTVAIMIVYGLLAEVVGKALVGSHMWRVIEFSYPALRLLHFIFKPISNSLVALQERISDRQAPEDEDEKSTTADEIISLVEQDAHEEEAESDLEDSERRMIRGIFDLDETLVKEIMTPRVDIDALSLTATIPEAKKIIVDSGHSRIPVYNESIDQIVGIVYAKDLLNDPRIERDKSLKSLLHSPIFVPETKNIGDLLDEFKQTKKQIAVIIDEYGGTAGLVTIEDILEEIVGEIRDEYDEHEVDAPYTVDADGQVFAEARTPIDEINELLDAHIPDDEDYDTVGGYITTKLGRIPKPDEVLHLDGLEVQILEADERKISRLKLRRQGSTPAPSDVTR